MRRDEDYTIMVLSLTIPELGKSGRIKDLVIDILSFEWPLTLSQIHNKVNKSYNCGITCQATYKAITELVNENVISKQDKTYQINLEWVEKLREFSVHIEKNYRGNNKVPLVEGVLKIKTENNITILTFNSLIEMDKMWINIKKEYYKKNIPKGDITLWEGNHCWWLLVYPELEYSEIELMKKKGVSHYMINHGSTNLDKWAKSFYERAGVKFKISKETSYSDIAVFGDTIMQVSLPSDLRDNIEEIYKKCGNNSTVDIPSFIKSILNKKTSINLILSKNKDIAEQLKKKAKNEFNLQVKKY
ncbi:MAG: hypothetical protein Q8Q31_05600 [Nanoarchaeota archaeon]|nr:hypothetical protein [Nanoarchaeota archaeon]